MTSRYLLAHLVFVHIIKAKKKKERNAAKEIGAFPSDIISRS